MERSEALKTWPSDIFLQAGEDYYPLDNYKEYSEITWAEDGIGREDVKYVREDIHAALEAENTALREELDELIFTNKVEELEREVISLREKLDAAEQLAIDTIMATPQPAPQAGDALDDSADFESWALSHGGFPLFKHEEHLC